MIRRPTSPRSVFVRTITVAILAVAAVGTGVSPQLVLASPAAAAAPHLAWTGPKTIGGTVTGLSCPTATFCAAVDDVGQIVIFDGANWTVPAVIDSVAALESISCPSATFCVAVDQAGEYLTYTSGTWSAPTAVPGAVVLSAVSCTSSTFCAAVGVGDGFTFDGSTWTHYSAIDTFTLHSLNSISCVSPTFCVAVGYKGAETAFNGSAWSATQNIDGGAAATVTDVSCASTSFCVATASDGTNNPIVYNGTTWDNSQTVSGGVGFNAVSCTSPSFCMVGGTNVSTYNGSTWSNASAIPDGGTTVHRLSCLSAAFCEAIQLGGRAFTYTGTWTNATVIDMTNGIFAVSCASSSLCVAVGGNGGGAIAGDGVALVYDGTSWSKPMIAEMSADYLNSVSCAPGTTFCMATDAGGNWLTYNAGAWSSASPIGLLLTQVASISCTSTTFCIAVGNGFAGGAAATWNGSGWSTYQFGTPAPAMVSVSCATSTFCVAVDDAGNTSTYNGTTWSAETSIDNPVNPLVGVSCAPNTTTCVAVDSGGNAVTLNNGTWSAPTQAPPTGSLVAISCPSATYCVADGSNGMNYFDGTSWSSTTGGSRPDEWLSCPSTTFCVGVANTGSRLMIGEPAVQQKLVFTTQPGGGAANGAWATQPVVTIEDSLGNTIVSDSNAITLSIANNTGSGTLSGCFGQTVAGVASFGGCQINAVGTGYTLSATDTADGISATSAPFNVTTPLLVPTAPTISNLPSTGTYGDSFTPVVSTTGDGTKSVTSSSGSVCIVTAGVVNYVGVGTCTLRAHVTVGMVYAAGEGADNSFLVKQATTQTTIKSTVTSLNFGAEQSATFTVTVTPQFAGTTPSGTVRLLQGGNLVCSLSLFNGSAACSPSPTALSAGSVPLVARYGGDPNFTASSSTALAMSVSKAATTTALVASGVHLRYGHEKSERLSVTVSSRIPRAAITGRVVVKSGRATVCVVTLRGARGWCVLSAKKLPVGTQRLIATYGGATNFKGSTSRTVTVNVKH